MTFKLFSKILYNMDIRLKTLDYRSLYKEYCRVHSTLYRHYHTIKHIDHGLDILKKMKINFNSPLYHALIFAWLYHDYWYFIGYSDNERKSANHARNILKNFVTKSAYIFDVPQLIMATTHRPRMFIPDWITKLIQDLDLAILGETVRRYNVYAVAIRKEYGGYSDKTYKKGRIKFLLGMLGRLRIYTTEHKFFKKYEERARVNMTRELRQLLCI